MITDPMFSKILNRKLEFSASRIGYPNELVRYPVHHHKMALVPMHNHRQRCAIERRKIPVGLEWNLDAHRPVADTLRGLADPLEGDAFPIDIASLPELLQAEGLPVKGGDHPQTGRSAIHGVMLRIKRERFSAGERDHARLIGLGEDKK